MTRLDISIINYFEKGIPYDIFIQGFYITNILIIAFLFLIYLMPPFHQQNESFVDFYLNIIKRKLSLNDQISESRPNNTIDAVKTNSSLNGSNLFDKLIKLFQVFSFSVVITILSFTMGTIFSNVSDSFMDQNNYFHLGLKKNWASFDTSENLANTDDKIKYFVFNKIFGNESLNKSVIDSVLKSTTKYSMVKNEKTKNKNTIRKFIIKELYYTSKHKILENDKWRNYLMYSQTLINLNQTFCFGMWILFIFSMLGFINTLIASIKAKYFDKEKSAHTLSELITLSVFTLILLVNIFLPISLGDFMKIFLLLISLGLIFLILFHFIHNYRLTTSLMLVIVSGFLYNLTAIAWMNCEEESCAKIYGLLIHFDDKLSNLTLDILKNSILSH